MGENEEGTGAGRAVRPRRSRGADEGLGGVGAHPASLAVRRTSPKAGGRGSACPRDGFARTVVPHPGTQARETARGRWPRHRLKRWVSDRSAGITVSYGHQFHGAKALAPRGDLEPQGLLSESTIRRPSFEFPAVKHWANHVISLKSVHWRPGPGSTLKHSLSPLPSTPLFVPRLCTTAVSSEGNRLLGPSPGLLSSELSKMHTWSCPALKSSDTGYPTGVTSPQRGELGQRLEAWKCRRVTAKSQGWLTRTEISSKRNDWMHSLSHR